MDNRSRHIHPADGGAIQDGRSPEPTTSRIRQLLAPFKRSSCYQRPRRGRHSLHPILLGGSKSRTAALHPTPRTETRSSPMGSNRKGSCRPCTQNHVIALDNHGQSSSFTRNRARSRRCEGWAREIGENMGVGFQLTNVDGHDLGMDFPKRSKVKSYFLPPNSACPPPSWRPSRLASDRRWRR
jgi:hypothetical protein